jgi:hypothetical protein
MVAGVTGWVFASLTVFVVGPALANSFTHCFLLFVSEGEREQERNRSPSLPLPASIYGEQMTDLAGSLSGIVLYERQGENSLASRKNQQ